MKGPQNRSRREFLVNSGAGFGSLALIDLLSRDGFLFVAGSRGFREGSSGAKSVLANRPPHFPTKAKHVVFLFMNGAQSGGHVRPQAGANEIQWQPVQGDTVIGSNNRPIGHLMQSPFEFAKHGQSGLEISSLFPNIAKHADDLCVIRSLQTIRPRTLPVAFR